MEAQQTTGLTPEEWSIVEHLNACINLIDELTGLDASRFASCVEALRDDVCALPVKRALGAKQ